MDQHTRPPEVLILASFLKDSQVACKEGSRAKEMEEGVIRNTLVDEHRYMEVPTKQSPSPLFSVFGQPLIFWGSSSQRGSLDTIDLEPLRVVAADGSEWRLENFEALVEAEEGLEEDRQWTEEVQSMSSEGSTYEN